MNRYSNLDTIFNTHILKQYYDTHKNEPWNTWLVFNSLFESKGKQGIAGLFTLNTTQISEQLVFKISQHVNYLVHHEYTIMDQLNKLAPYCPHFCQSIGYTNAPISTDRKQKSPFKNTYKDSPLETEVLLLEHIEGKKFYKLIRDTTLENKVMFSSVKQMLLGLEMAQIDQSFVHYDLQSNNIIMRQCDPDVVFVYKFGGNNQFAVPTYGYYPVAIDFGFSYSDALQGREFWPTMGHTNYGFNSMLFDPIADPKLFLTTVSQEIDCYRSGKQVAVFKNICDNLFDTLDIDMSTGWDTRKTTSIVKNVSNILKNTTRESSIFYERFEYCIDIIQTLIRLPFKPRAYKDIHVGYIMFVKEFSKIENQIVSSYCHLYILKAMVDIAKQVKVDFMNKDTRYHALSYFKTNVIARIDKVTKFVKVSSVDFTILLTGLFCIASKLEGIYYDKYQVIKKDKQAIVNTMPIKRPGTMFGVIDINIPSEYYYTPETTVIILDSIQKKSSVLKLSRDDCDTINDSHKLSIGQQLVQIHQNVENVENIENK